MAVALECIDFIVPIETIRRKYPGVSTDIRN